eukprot:11741404-Karenia_brevis.AAC.1
MSVACVWHRAFITAECAWNWSAASYGAPPIASSVQLVTLMALEHLRAMAFTIVLTSHSSSL